VLGTAPTFEVDQNGIESQAVAVDVGYAAIRWWANEWRFRSVLRFMTASWMA
jgi:hypothetical protein